MDKIKKKDIICIIPARGGSKELKKKNLQKVLNKKLIRYPIEYALNSKLIGTVLVSTDDKNIAKEARKAGAITPFIRPKKISGDFTTTEETLKFSLLKYEKIIKKKFKICIFLTCTEIFRNPKWINQGLNILKKDKKIESVFIGTRSHKNFWEKINLKGIQEWRRMKSYMKIYSSRQIRKSIIREDTGLFCASRSELWRNGRRIGDKVKIILNDQNFNSIDIHNKKDLQLADTAMRILYSKKNIK